MASSLVPSPSFCYIAPTAYLQYVRASTTHLVLAHLVDTDPTYAAFYASLSDDGHFIMMDNSAYELKVPYEPERLVELAARCKAHAVVLPDYPFQPSQVTIDAAYQFIPVFKAARLLTFFVPQSTQGDLEDWVKGYTWASMNPDVDIIGMSILGIPNALPSVDPSFARVVMTSLLLDRDAFNKKKHHHYLGLNAGPALEIPSLLRMGVLDTIDSSNPIWMGILGHTYSTNTDSLLSVRKVNLPVDFKLKWSKDAATHTRIETNIELTNSLFESTDARVWYAQE